MSLAKALALVEKRQKYFARLQILYDISKSVNKDTLSQFRARYEKIEEVYNSFEDIQDEIASISVQLKGEEKLKLRKCQRHLMKCIIP